MIKINSIQVLPENITNMIAAGEVIERPASIVKELLENSIDAMSNQITVLVRNGGKSLIKIVDNGEGMTHDDAILAFERHATSKITAIEDLNTIETLGFRGEALPSIASISRLKIVSKTDADETGSEIQIEGGKVNSVKEVAAPTGTSIEVNEIFFNTPARKKFLRRDSTEMSYISQVLNTVSIARSDIQFRLISGEKEVVNSPAANDLKVRIGDLFGKDIVEDLIPVFTEANNMKLTGYISRPSFSLSSRRHQFFYVNNRCIKDKTVNHSIYHAYRTLLPKDRHPALFLFFTMPPDNVDVNVHPAKAEVRFVNQKTVHDFVYHAVSKALLKYKSQDSSSAFQAPESSADIKDADISRNANWEGFKFSPTQGSINFFNKTDVGSNIYDEQETTPEIISKSKGDFDYNMPTPIAKNNFVYSKCRPVGQIENSFVVLENSSNLILVDQHTAHERILFEKLEREFKNSKIRKQQLLFPISIELSHGESILLEKHLKEISKVGLDVEYFGKNTFIIRSVPSILEGKDYSALLMEIVDILAKSEKTGSFEQIFMETFKIIACHGAIRAHQKLEIKEIQSLFQELDKTELPYTCPHGRPISLVFSLKDIKKNFLRI